MNVSAQKGDGFRVAKVLVDGRDITADCYEADDDLGYALCYKRNEAGNLCTTDDHRKIATERLEGRVEIILRSIA